MIGWFEKYIKRVYYEKWNREGFNQGYLQATIDNNKQIIDDILEVNGEKIYIMREVDYQKLLKRVPGGFDETEVTVNKDRVSNISDNWVKSKTIESIMRRLDRIESMVEK